MNTPTKSKTHKFVLPKTVDGCSCTITATFDRTSLASLLSTAHFPKGGVLIIREI